MTIEQQTLFGGFEAEGLDDEQLRMSADRKRTVRQREALAHGAHPLGLVLSGHLRLHPEAAPANDLTAAGRRGGNCAFRVSIGWHDRTWPKCTFGQATDASTTERTGAFSDRIGPRVSHGGATDVRAWWPACIDHQLRSDA